MCRKKLTFIVLASALFGYSLVAVGPLMPRVPENHVRRPREVGCPCRQVFGCLGIAAAATVSIGLASCGQQCGLQGPTMILCEGLACCGLLYDYFFLAGRGRRG